MAKLRAQGAAVILISANLDEILSNADRIIVLYRGAAAAEFRNIDGAADTIKEEIGAYMLGLKKREAAGETAVLNVIGETAVPGASGETAAADGGLR
jgi:simple sugar transport system ATP-binding protein